MLFVPGAGGSADDPVRLCGDRLEGPDDVVQRTGDYVRRNWQPVDVPGWDDHDMDGQAADSADTEWGNGKLQVWYFDRHSGCFTRC